MKNEWYAIGALPKGAAQHSRDMAVVEATLPHKFLRSDGSKKPISMFRVDGGADEGPKNREVRYYHAQRHLERSEEVTLVTARQGLPVSSHRFTFQLHRSPFV